MSNDLPPSREHPTYTMINMATLIYDADGCNNYMITVHDGEHTDVLCDGLSQRTAEWLVGVLADRPPYPLM